MIQNSENLLIIFICYMQFTGLKMFAHDVN